MENQVERLIRPQDGEIPTADDGLSPLMPFPTGYQLDRDQEEELVNHAMTRLQELEGETGRDACGKGDWWSGNNVSMSVEDMEGVTKASRSWMGKRQLYDLTYKNEVEFRANLLEGIFATSNLVVPAARRICRQMIARAVNYFFGTDPWFAVYPVGVMDKVRADKADRYVRWKMDQAHLKEAESLAIERAFVINEAVVKTSWAHRGQIYRTTAEVLVDAAGKDILGADGDYIMSDDLWIEPTVTDPQTGEEQPSGMLVLKRDGATPKPPVMTFVSKQITRRITHYKGPEAKVINFLDFLCPLDASSIQEADCVVHLYDMPLMTLADQWNKSISAGATAEQRQIEMRKSIELLRTLAAGNETTSGQNSDSVDDSTHSGRYSQKSQPLVEIAEFHLRYDCDGDGILEDVMLIVDRKSRTPIFYDYEANVTPDGLRPFSVTRVNEVPGRWYGIGGMEMFNSSQQIIDLMVNRWNFANSKAARVDFWSPHNTVEGRANPSLELNGGNAYTPVSGKGAKDCLESVFLTDEKGEKLKEMAEFFMQLMTNESGVSNANDGNIAGMDTTKLATGIRNIEKSGQELFSLHLGHIEPGVSETLDKMVKLVFSNLDVKEVYRYFEEGEGGEGGGELREINAGDIANIEIDTRVLLTRYRGEQILESYTRGWEIVDKFYMQPFEVQTLTADMARGMLKAMQIQDSDKIIQPTQVVPVGPSPGLPDAKVMASAATPPPREGRPNL